MISDASIEQPWGQFAAMSQRTSRLRKVALSALHYSGADSMIAPFTRGLGAILTLRHVSPDKPGAFEPNRDYKVTPHFIVQVIQQVRAAGFEIVSLDEAHFRLVEGDYGRPFVCFAFDDGYRDLYEHAYPIFHRYDLPFAVYIPTDYPDGDGDLSCTNQLGIGQLGISPCRSRDGAGNSVVR